MQVSIMEMKHDSDITDDCEVYSHILHLLKIYHTAICVDECDRLYSLCGILPGTGIHDKQHSRLSLPCPVDYNVHFSHAYTTFASTAIELGLFSSIIEHTIEFGGLTTQKESWPSWVPSWNLTRKMQDVEYLVRELRPPQYNQRFDNSLITDKEGLWKGGSVCLADVYGLRALQLRGCIHRVVNTQSSTNYLDAISYLETVVRSHRACRDSAMSSHIIAWVIACATYTVPNIYLRSSFGVRNVFVTRPFLPLGDPFERQKLILIAAKGFLGLQSDDESEEQFKVDMDKFTSEALRALEGSEGFCYECDGSLAYGIAFAHVKPGDYVFRTPGTARAISYKSDDIAISAFGLIIQPYHSQSSAGPATFRLLGMCLDCYLNNNDPEVVEVVLV